MEFGKVEGNFGKWGRDLEIWGWTLVYRSLDIWINRGSILIIGMTDGVLQDW